MHNFNRSLQYEEQCINSGGIPWEVIIRYFFPNIESIGDFIRNVPTQKNGKDIKIFLDNGRSVSIDFKFRDKKKYLDGRDILYEKWSSVKDGVPGWGKTSKSDYILMMFSYNKKAICIPTKRLQETWQKHNKQWTKYAKRKMNGFREVYAKNKSNNSVYYTTLSIAIPTELLLESIPEINILDDWTELSNNPKPSILDYFK